MPVIGPPTVRAPLPLTVTVGEAFMVTAPVPRLSGLLPTKVKLPFQARALLAASVSEPPLVLSSEPPEMVTRPVPSGRAAAEVQESRGKGRRGDLLRVGGVDGAAADGQRPGAQRVGGPVVQDAAARADAAVA